MSGHLQSRCYSYRRRSWRARTQSLFRSPRSSCSSRSSCQLAVAATLATMLVRFRWFRRILLTERRDWPERLVFAAGLGVPLDGRRRVAAAAPLRRRGPDAVGAFLAGLIAGPYAGALVGPAVGIAAALRRRIGALPFAVGCGFAGGGLREICPKEEIWRFSPFFFTQAAPLGLAAHAQLLARLAGHPRHGAGPARAAAADDLSSSFRPASSSSTRRRSGSYLLVILATVLGVAIPIKIWNSARIEHRLAEQEKLLMAARVEALANQINPHFLFNTLTSISSLIRSQPETARVLIVKLSGLLRRLLRSQEHFVTLREELAAIDEYLDIERIRFGPSLVVEKVDRRSEPRHHRAEHDPAAARRELDQARARPQGRRGTHHDPGDASGRTRGHRSRSTTASACRAIGWSRPANTASACATSTSGCA